MRPRELAGLIDHTILKPEATGRDIDRACTEALEYGFCALCVAPVYVGQAAGRLRGSAVSVCTVVGFPLGNNLTATKADEARRAIGEGASEIDMVAALGALLTGEQDRVRDDIAGVVEVVRAAFSDSRLKVILETAILSAEQIELGCHCCVQAGADFVKTSTGFHPAGGASVEAVRQLKQFAAPLRVKASGGIRDLKTALAMFEAGADRLGTSSSVALMKALQP